MKGIGKYKLDWLMVTDDGIHRTRTNTWRRHNTNCFSISEQQISKVSFGGVMKMLRGQHRWWARR